MKPGPRPVGGDAVDRSREPGTSSAAAIQNAAELGSPARAAPGAGAPRPALSVTRAPSRRSSTPIASSIRSVWSRLGSGSTTRRRAVGEEPREQHRRLDLGARDRQRVLDPTQRRAVHDERRRPARRAASIPAPIARAAARSDRRGRRRIDSSPSSVKRAALLAREPAGQQPQQRPRVAHVDRPRRLARAPQPTPVTRTASRLRLARRRRARARRRASPACPPRAGSPRSAPRPRPSPRGAPRDARSTCPPAPTATRAAPPRRSEALRRHRHGSPQWATPPPSERRAAGARRPPSTLTAARPECPGR